MVLGANISSMYYILGVPGSASMQISDSDYGLATRSYLTGPFARFYEDKMKSMEIETWDEQSDCDNFAWMFFVDAQWSHYRTKKSTKQGLGVGVCYYMAGIRPEGGGGGGHAINTALVKENDEYKIIFIEPQLAAVGRPCLLELTQAEIESIWVINF